MEEKGHDLVRTARIGKPHGIRGEVTVKVFTDSPEARFAAGRVLQVHNTKNRVKWGALTVENARWNKKILLLKFVEFSDRNTAESLRGAELYAPVDERSDEDSGWYAHELVGFDVHEQSVKKAIIGRVSDLTTSGAQDILEVQLIDGRVVLIPFVKEIVPEIDVDKGVVVITPPPGLLELNLD
jgi:16S rRNA processing protein RimM